MNATAADAVLAAQDAFLPRKWRIASDPVAAMI